MQEDEVIANLQLEVECPARILDLGHLRGIGSERQDVGFEPVSTSCYVYFHGSVRFASRDIAMPVFPFRI